MIGAIWVKFQGWLALGGLVIAAVAVAFVRGRAEGKKIIEAEQQKRRLESVQQRKAIDDETDQMGAADVDSAYQRWLRDNER